MSTNILFLRIDDLGDELSAPVTIKTCRDLVRCTSILHPVIMIFVFLDLRVFSLEKPWMVSFVILGNSSSCGMYGARLSLTSISITVAITVVLMVGMKIGTGQHSVRLCRPYSISISDFYNIIIISF